MTNRKYLSSEPQGNKVKAVDNDKGGHEGTSQGIENNHSDELIPNLQCESPRAPLKPDDPLGHSGEIEMRLRLPSRYHWDEHNLPAMMHSEIRPSLARFIEALPFFFIATANNDGHCDCSFRGQEYDAWGKTQPVLKVIDSKQLLFPDFSGNGLYNSLGNIQVNPHIGMLFMDFERQRRARINGVARIIAADVAVKKIWPSAQAGVLVTVEQAYGNCPARIPRLKRVEQE